MQAGVPFRLDQDEIGPNEFFEQRLRKNLNLKPKKKLSKHAQAKLEWYKRRRRR